MPFEDVLGQNFAVRILKSALASGRLASSYLFYGPEGCGKKTTALALAQALYCQQGKPKGQEACGQCDICRRISQGKHPDVLLFAPQGSQFKIELARAVLHEAGLRPYEAAGRFFILDQVELFNDASGNALLKLLEEPPQGYHFILVSSQAAKIMATITSRCQAVCFSPLAEESVVTLLCKQKHCSPVKAKELARLAGGSLRKAGLLMEDEGKHWLEFAEGFLEAASSDSSVAKMDWAWGAAADKEAVPEVLSLIGVYLRELWARQAELPATLHWLQEMPRHGKSLSPLRLQGFLTALGKAQDAIRKNANVSLALEVFALSA